MRAIWNEAVLAESDDTVVVGCFCASMRPQHWDVVPGEGKHYFPADALRREHFRASGHKSTCPWKGMASYYDVVVGDEVNPNVAWYYPQPKDSVKEISGPVAFWKGVKVTF